MQDFYQLSKKNKINGYAHNIGGGNFTELDRTTEMLHFDNIKTYSTDYPKTWSFLGSPEDANAIPEEHKDQIFFLNKEATTFLKNYLDSAKMIKWPAWEPFNERYFKTIQSFEVTENRENEIKKWLYHKPISFDKFVFVDNQINGGQEVMLTWKMVIKYWEGLFRGEDSIIFDETLNWGLYYWHEDKLFFGMDKIYDKEYEYEKTREYHELKEKFFKKGNENINMEDKQKSIQNFKEKYDT